LLLALAVITLAGRAAGAFAERWLRQPAVIGEIALGLLVGPSLVGRLMPRLSQFLWPAAIIPQLGMIAKIGVVLFMFLIGLELDGTVMRRDARAALTIAHASIIVPFLCGSGLALVLYPSYARPDVEFASFALFLGISLSVTAFPVLARILAERNLLTTDLGVTAIACAAVADASAWCVLAVICGVAHSAVGAVFGTLILTAGFTGIMFVGVRPAITRLVRTVEDSARDVSSGVLSMVFAGVLLSAFATELIGIHALFGAFFFGAMIPPQSRLAEQVRVRLDDVVVVLLLPVFFTLSGLRTRLDLLSELNDWLCCAAVIGAATFGKVGGTFIAARAAGLGRRDASALGVLMNTRGLMELIVLNMGLDMGILSPRLFAILVVMALVTTFGTTPLLSLIIRAPEADRESIATNVAYAEGVEAK
jgi:Kef-type K+ transport system membrane component KefB